MSQALGSSFSAPSHVWHLRRKKVPDELSLPADYVPTDYTSLPPDEPKKSSPLRPILFLLVLLAVLGAVAYAVFVLPNNGDGATATAVPAGTITFDRARMLISEDKLTTQIDATSTNLPDGTTVTATMLENDVPFEFLDAEAATGAVTGGAIKLSIPETAVHENGRKSAKYSVKLTATLADGKTVEASENLEINQAALTRFLGEGADVAAATTAPTTAPATAAPTTTDPPTAAPVEPTAAPAGTPPVALENVVISRGGIAYGTPYGPALQQGNVNANDIARIVVKLPVNGETWYLAAIPATGTAGWINSSLIDLPASDVNQITTVSGEAPFAVVRNGGNVRSAPGGDVLRQVEAGLQVRLVARTADNAWFKIEIGSDSGWVSGQLLTINPDVAAGVAVAP